MSYEQRDMVIEDKKFSIYGERGDKGAPRLFFSVTQNGNPSMMVFPNDPSDTERKPIRGAMDPVIWSLFVETCRHVFTSDEAGETRIDLRGGKPTNTFTESVIIVGKDTNGVCYLALIMKDRAKKRFMMLPGLYADLIDKDGKPLPDGVKSRMFATAFINALNVHVNMLIDKYYKPYVTPGNDGGNNNRQTGGGGGFSDYDNSIPF